MRIFFFFFVTALLFARKTLMVVNRGALQLLLRPLSPRMSVFLSFSNLHLWRFQNPILSPTDSRHLYFSSSSRRSTVDSVKLVPLNRRRFRYKIFAVTEESGGYRRTERRKRGRKRRELWEQLFEDNVEDDEDDDNNSGGRGDGKFDLWKILEEIIDNVWILKALRSYGYLLPFIILSLFFSTGPKAFLVSLGVAIGPSLLFYAFQKLIGWDKRRRTSMANQFGIESEDEEIVEERRRTSRVQYINPSMVRNNVNNGREVNRSSAEMASNFGGWDELDGRRTVPEQQPTSKPKRKRVRRREKAAQPLLLRLLVSLFPFLSTYTNMLK